MSINKKRKIGFLILILVLLLGLWSCAKDGNPETKTADSKSTEVVGESKTTSAAVSEEAISTAGSIEKTSENKAAQKSAAAVSPQTKTESNVQKKNAIKGTETKKSEEYSIKLSGSGFSGDTVFSETDLKKLGTESYTYSFRNKEKNNVRQYETFTGVPVATLLKAAGWNGTSDELRITCADGYSNRYKISEINTFYAYQDGSEGPGATVPAMIAILKEGSYMGNDLYYHHDDGPPFRLVYGQADYDSDFTKDFNMQGWGYYISAISID